jgi:hypothetical protein
MSRVLCLLVLAACSSRERTQAHAGSGSASAAPVAPAKPALPWKPFEIEKQPVVQLEAVPKLSDGKLVYMGGRALTATGSYSVIWTLDKLEAFPGRGRRSLPDGTWLTFVESQGEKFVLSLGTSDAQGEHFRTFETADEPIEVIAQIGESRFEVLVFREGERWRVARSTDQGAHWKTDVLPMKGANVASAVDPSGIDVALAWNDGAEGKWMHLRGESAEKRTLPVEKLAGKITSTCANDYLWVATDKNTVQRLPYGQAQTFSSAPSIVACNGTYALVKLADGSAQLCSSSCEAATIPKAEPAVQTLIGKDLVIVEQAGDTLAITRNGKRTEYDAGGVIQRMQLVDFDGTPVLVAYGRESLDPSRWTVVP